MSNTPSDEELTACYREANGEMHGKAQPLTTQRIFKAMRAAIVKFGTPQPAPAPLSRDQIREVFMAHGFTIKEGQTDLKQYVYDAAYALLGTKPAPLSDDVVKDAARYAALRDGSIEHDDILKTVKDPGKWEQPYAVLLRGIELDSAIDAALRAQGENT